MIIQNCPVCGRPPKIKVEFIYMNVMQVTISCKPFLNKEHLCVSATGSNTVMLREEAASEWNAQVSKYRRMHENTQYASGKNATK